MRQLLKRLLRKEGELFSVRVTKSQYKPARVELDGEDISDKLFEFEYRIDRTAIPTVTITFPCKSIEIESVAELSKILSEQKGDA